ALPAPETFLAMARLASSVWAIAVQIAAPVTVAIFVQNVATGVLSRALPQLNILIVNLPLHVGIVLLLLGLGANELVHAMKDRIEVWPEGVSGVLAGGGQGGGGRPHRAGDAQEAGGRAREGPGRAEPRRVHGAAARGRDPRARLGARRPDRADGDRRGALGLE